MRRTEGEYEEGEMPNEQPIISVGEGTLLDSGGDPLNQKELANMDRVIHPVTNLADLVIDIGLDPVDPFIAQVGSRLVGPEQGSGQQISGKGVLASHGLDSGEECISSWDNIPDPLCNPMDGSASSNNNNSIEMSFSAGTVGASKEGEIPISDENKKKKRMEGKAKPMSSKKMAIKGRKSSNARIGGVVRFKDCVLHNQKSFQGIQKKRTLKNGFKRGGKASLEGMSNFNSSCSMSLTNKDRRKCVLSKKNPSVVANEVWNIGKSIGLNFNGNDTVLIQRLGEMEERDRREAGRVVGGRGG